MIGLICFVFLFAFSWSSVDPLYYGLKCNSLTKKCDDKNVYESGRYLIGPLNYFIPFPANYVNMEFSVSRYADSAPLKTRTKEGLALGISNFNRIAYIILISIIKRKDSIII